MTLQLRTPPKKQIIYPDSDGEPMADNTLQWDWIATIKLGLEKVFRKDANVFVAGDLLWYPVEGDNKSRAAAGRPGRYRPAQGLQGLIQAMGRRRHAAAGGV
jgi:hypothetical protein